MFQVIFILLSKTAWYDSQGKADRCVELRNTVSVVVFGFKKSQGPDYILQIRHAPGCSALCT